MFPPRSRLNRYPAVYTVSQHHTIASDQGFWPKEPRVPLPYADMEPFPVYCFPDLIQDYVVQSAEELCCDPAVIALPLLAGLAAATGGNRSLRLKRTWLEPSVLWTAVVTDGVDPPAPQIDAAIGPLEQRESAALQQYQRQRQDYEQALAEEKRSRKTRKKSSVGDDEGAEPVPAPVEPGICRYVVRDWGLTSLTNMLSRQSRGFLVRADRVDDWLGKPNSSGCRRATEVNILQSLFDRRPLTIERRSVKQPLLHLTQASVSVTGTVAAETLKQKFLHSKTACGLTNRLLFARPISLPKTWSDAEVSDEVVAGYEQVIDKLLSLSDGSSETTGTEGDSPDQVPSVVTLSPEAKEMFACFVDDIGHRTADADESLRSWWANLTSQAARLALVIHLARWGSGEQVDPAVCDTTSLEQGLTLACWFAREAERAVAVFSIPPSEQERIDVFDQLYRMGGFISPTELSRTNRRKYPTEEDAWQALNRVHESGVARWRKLSDLKRGMPPDEVLWIFGEDKDMS